MTRDLTAAEKLAAHGAMRAAFANWNPGEESLFDLSQALNGACARAIHDIKNARRHSAGDARP